MKALVLAAGFGTRLRPLTEKLPKPLFPVANRPMINLILDYLKSCGVKSTGINTHHLRDLLNEHLRTIKEPEIFIKEEKEKILGTGGGLAGFREFLDGEEFFINHTCDILTTIDIKDAVKYHRENENIATFILVDCEPINHVSLLEDGSIVDIGNRLGRYGEKNIKNLAGSGIVIYSKEIFQWLPRSRQAFEIHPTLLEIIEKKPDKIKGYIAKKPYYWRDIGTIQSYWEAHRDILIKKLYPKEKISSSHIIHKDAQIEDGVNVEGFIAIGRGARAYGDIKIKDSIIWDDAVISEKGYIKNSIITKDFKVEL